MQFQYLIKNKVHLCQTKHLKKYNNNTANIKGPNIAEKLFSQILAEQKEEYSSTNFIHSYSFKSLLYYA